MTTPSELVWRRLHWPSPLSSDLALQLLQRLSGDERRSAVLFEARAAEGAVSHYMATAAHNIRELSATVGSMITGTDHEAAKASGQTASVRLTINGSALALLDRSAEAARAVLAALSAARFRGEALTLQIAMGRGIAPRLHGRVVADPTQSLFSLLARGARPASGDVDKSLRAKAAESGFRVIVRAGVTANSPGRRRELLSGLLAALRVVQAPGTRLDFIADRSRLDDLPSRGWLTLSATDLRSLLGWPLESQNLPGMPSPHPKLLAPPRTLAKTDRTFAISNAPGEEKPIGIAIDDALFHTVVLGPTGSGKSTTLTYLISGDLKAGRSVVVLDPKRDLVSDVLERIPASRADDVVLLDPTQTESPVGLNPLIVPGTSPELIADGILGIFRDLFPSAFGPMTSDAIHASVLSLAYVPNATLTMLPRLLTDARYRRGLLAHIRDQEDLLVFWDAFEALSDRQRSQFIGPVLSRLRQFLLRASLKRTLDQPEPRFALSDLFTSPRVLLVPVNSGQLGNEAARLFGSLLVSQLWHLTLARASQPQAARLPVSIYIDEAQEFIRIGDLADALARSRSLGVAWHIAHQFRAQMPVEMRSAIDANARNKIIFGLPSDDAKAMATMAPELTAEDFMSLPKYAAYVRLMAKGQQLNWISAQALEPLPRISDPDELAERSQRRYGFQLPSPEDHQSAGVHLGEATTAFKPHDDAPIGRKRRSP
jgi:hypothetical protein